MNYRHMYQHGEFHNIGQKRNTSHRKNIKTDQTLWVDSYLSGKVIKEKE